MPRRIRVRDVLKAQRRAERQRANASAPLVGGSQDRPGATASSTAVAMPGTSEAPAAAAVPTNPRPIAQPFRSKRGQKLKGAPRRRTRRP